MRKECACHLTNQRCCRKSTSTMQSSLFTFSPSLAFTLVVMDGLFLVIVNITHLSFACSTFLELKKLKELEELKPNVMLA